MKLDKDQEKAIKCIKNHSIIIAGAGCGKTTTLIGKVDYLIKNHVKENEILVLSFTNEAVNNFIQKCKYKINVSTFHKTALMFINNEYEIADEYIIEDVINSFLENISNKLKNKLFHIWYKYKKYSKENYKEFINDESSSSIKTIIKSSCKLIKTNNIDINKINANKFTREEFILLYIIKNVIDIYNNTLKENNLIDFDDMIIMATKNLINKKVFSHYKHVLVDEYQDISMIRLNFLKALIKSNDSILTAVGDDFQSIYQFSGSNISLFTNFDKYFKNAEKFFITNTYRCPYKIIKLSSKFILKNKNQIKKELTAINKNKCIYKKIYTSNHKKALYKLLKKIDLNKSILILSRNTFDINNYLSKEIKHKDGKIIIKNKIYKNINFMTIHKSKGLEADIVIVLNLTSNYNGLPSKKTNKLFEKLLSYHEPIKYAEERRLFYVALTRTKSDLYLIIDRNNSSVFINEV